MKALVGAFNQKKALVGAFSVIVKTGCGTDGALHSTIVVSVTTTQFPQYILNPDCVKCRCESCDAGVPSSDCQARPCPPAPRPSTSTTMVPRLEASQLPGPSLHSEVTSCPPGREPLTRKQIDMII